MNISKAVNAAITATVFAVLVASAAMLYASGAKSASFDKAACPAMKAELAKASTKEALSAFLVKHSGVPAADAAAMVAKASVAGVKKQLGDEIADSCK